MEVETTKFWVIWMVAEEPVDESEMTLAQIFSSGDTGAITMTIILALLLILVFGVILWKIIQQRRLLILINQINRVKNRKDVREVTMRMKKADVSYADQYQMETLTESLAELEQAIEDRLSFG